LTRIINTLTEAQWFQDVMSSLQSYGVPISSWLSRRNPGLSISKYLARVLSVWDSFLAQLEDSQFLQSATGVGLFKFGRSQYQLEPFPERTQLARFVLSDDLGSPDHSVAAGDLVIGLRGGSIEWVNTEAVELQNSKRSVVLFEAREAGTAHNVGNDSPLELLTTLAGVRIANPAVGQATTFGLGNASLIFFAADEDVKVAIVDPLSPSQPLVLNLNLGAKEYEISLATDAGGLLISTPAQVQEAIKGAIAATPLTLLLMDVRFSGTGMGVVQPASQTTLKWSNSYIERAGASQESEDSYRRRCFLRFMTLGGWAGDGAPPSPVGTDEALEFWARNPPAGQETSSVTGVKVLSNFLSGSPSGKDITILIWGPAGALSADETTAVEANFYNGRKFSTGCDLHLLTVMNIVVGMGGTVYVKLSAGYTADQVRAAIITRFAEYRSKAAEPGMTIEPTILSARIADALPDGVITSVDLTLPPSPSTLTWQQFPDFDIAALVVQFV
jgi:hypothetical protein